MRELRGGDASSSRPARILRALIVFVVIAGLAGSASPARAAPARVVTEVDPIAESMLDARAVRRLVSLELAEVDVPPAQGSGKALLYFRVVGLQGQQVRVELWERGEPFDVRVVSAEGGAHLLVRRVALAAAELARRLRQKRVLQRRQAERQREQARIQAQLERSRTREGPLALRSELSALRAEDQSLFGTSLTAEITLRHRLRLDFGASLLGGVSDASLATQRFIEVQAGPALRARLSPRFDLDLGALLRAGVVHVGGAESVDAIAGQRDTWSARGGIVLRAEPSLSRWIRFSVGLEAGLVLRPFTATFSDGSEQRFGGGYAGASLGLVLTPRPVPSTR